MKRFIDWVGEHYIEIALTALVIGQVLEINLRFR